MAGVISTVPSKAISAIKARTDNLPATPAGETTVAAVKAQTDKLAGQTPGSASITANWQSGTGTSGETGADLISIGAAGDRKKLHSLIVDIGALTTGASITIKLFMQVNAVWRKVYNQSFTVGSDPHGCWVVNGTLEIANVLRVECQSNNAADNGKAIAYEYGLEDM